MVNSSERLNIIIDFLLLIIYFISLVLIWNNVNWEGSTIQELALIIKLSPHLPV